MPAMSMAAQVLRAGARTHLLLDYMTQEKLPAALAVIGEKAVNFSKLNAPFQDQTGNLRRSIAYVVLRPGQSVTLGSDVRGGVPAEEGLVTVANTSKEVWLIVLAGMKYGVYVEHLPGYWVLSGGLGHVRPQIAALLGREAKFERLDLAKAGL